MTDSTFNSGKALPTGTVIRSDTDAYTIIQILGIGGFGITYKVTRQSDGGIFALKECFPNTLCERAEDHTVSYLKTNADYVEDCIRNFVTEAQRLDRHNISHPDIVEVYGVFKANKTAYYLMEYVEGKTLRQYVKGNRNRPLAPADALAVMRPVLEAVAYLHDHQLTHLDIKHDNIILSRDKGADTFRPVLIDFGQSKHYDRKGNATSTLTNAGCSEGFAPPEQYAGLSKFTPEADVYALGATLLYLLTARVPAKSTEITASAITEMLPTQTPDHITRAIIRAMAPDMRSRTPSARKFAQDLGLDLDMPFGGNPTALIKDKAHKSHRRLSRFAKTVWFYLACVSVVGGVAWLFVSKDSPTPSQRLSDAIVKGDYQALSRFAAEDSVRAFLPLARYYHSMKYYDDAIAMAEKALRCPADSLAAEGLLERWRSEKGFFDFVASSGSDNGQVKSDYTRTQDEANGQQDNSNGQQDKEKSKADQLKEALRNGKYGNIIRLANSGYAPAYYPLAKFYFDGKDYVTARRWANKAIQANSSASEARGIIRRIDEAEAAKAAQNAQTAATPAQQPTETSAQTAEDTASKAIDYYSLTEEELSVLARKGDVRAYAPLAVKAHRNGHDGAALRWAQRAQSSGTSTAESDEIYRKLSGRNN